MRNAHVARFGMRSKPKPFTSIAIFENQQRVSSLPDVVDPANSAIDAVILAGSSGTGHWMRSLNAPYCARHDHGASSDANRKHLAAVMKTMGTAT